jgi:hypothetical protein
MKSNILIYLITLIGTTCMAQTIPDPTAYEAKENLRELGSLSGTGHVRTFDNRYEGTKGTPYAFEEWLPGQIFLKSKNRIIIKEMNYNCFENEVAYLDPSSKAVMLINKYNIDLFYLISGADTLVFVPVQMEENKSPVFAQLLYRGESSLYKLQEKEFIRANYEGAYSADRKYDEFADKSSLYLFTQEESGLNKVKKSKKQFLALFPGAEDELSAFIKTEKLDLKLEEDIINLLRYYDSL